MERFFASDNCSGVHPEILKAIEAVNKGHVVGYGDDIYTKKAIEQFQKEFGEDVDVFFTFLGTGANVTGISSVLNPYQAVICAESAHINEDECGAVERFSGSKLIPIETHNGKLTVELIEPHYKAIGFEHHAQPKVISITQTTELGTVYRPGEIKKITDWAHQRNLLVHMDGARIANAAVFLNIPFKAFTKDVGVDILSFGGTKNGLMYGEAVVFFNSHLAQNYKYIRKQGMQLASKMRFIAAQFDAYFKNTFWQNLAKNANEVAQYLADEIKVFPFIELTQKVESNGLFVKLPKELAEALQEEIFFYDWDESNNVYRWMCSWDTTKDDVQSMIRLIQQKAKHLQLI
ncbi:MAG: low specificity L-threonine aldolase [Bacteroidales bacterium]|nr:low specificity L-threonine aldolase [Bacteroidales bacterium]